MATPTLAKTSSPQPDLSTTIITPSDEERRIRNAAMLLELWALGENVVKPTLETALHGFPDVNTYRAYHEGVGNEVE